MLYRCIVPSIVFAGAVFCRPSNPEAWERVQLRELKNGRLAMIAIAGMIAQESISGLGVLQRGDPYAGFV